MCTACCKLPLSGDHRQTRPSLLPDASRRRPAMHTREHLPGCGHCMQVPMLPRARRDTNQPYDLHGSGHTRHTLLAWLCQDGQLEHT